MGHFCHCRQQVPLANFSETRTALCCRSVKEKIMAVTFPNEAVEYRVARNRLPEAEMALRRTTVGRSDQAALGIRTSVPSGRRGAGFPKFGNGGAAMDAVRLDAGRARRGPGANAV